MLDSRVRNAQSRLVRELRAPLPQAASLSLASRSLARAGRDRIAQANHSVEHVANALALLNPSAVLDRGYAIVTSRTDEIVTDAARLRLGDDVALRLARGRAQASVTKTEAAADEDTRKA
jgi:exodeoxyribonuclease VII large subunit